MYLRMKKGQILLWLVLICSPLTGQAGVSLTDNIRPVFSVYTNFIGEGSMLSLKLEQLIVSSKYFLMAAGAGIGINNRYQDCLSGPCDKNPADYITFPHHVTICIGKGAHYLEAGAGGTVITGNTRKHYIPYPVAGYRIHPRNSRKPVFRLTLTYPLTRDLADIVYTPYGISIGISF